MNAASWLRVSLSVLLSFAYEIKPLHIQKTILYGFYLDNPEEHYSCYLKNSSLSLRIIGLSDSGNRAPIFVEAASSLNLEICCVAPILSHCDTIVDSEGTASLGHLAFHFPTDDGGIFSVRTLVSHPDNPHTLECNPTVVLEESIFEGIMIDASGDTFVCGGEHEEQKVQV